MTKPSPAIEHTELPVDGAIVRCYLVLPPGPGRHPVVLTTNRLEGTVQELLLPQLRYRNSGLGMFLMEMPGIYASAAAPSPRSARGSS